MTEAALRKELHSFIDILPVRKLHALKPLLSSFADETLVIETNLTAQEKAVVAKGRKKRIAQPESFTPWAEVRR